MNADSEVITRKLSPDELKKFYHGIRVQEVEEVFGYFIGEKCIGVAGVMCDPGYFGTIFEDDGSRYGFVDVRETGKIIARRVIHEMRQYLRERNKTLYVQCDDVNYPDAWKLLKVLGFIKTDKTEMDMRTKQHLGVWKWQALEQ